MVSFSRTNVNLKLELRLKSMKQQLDISESELDLAQNEKRKFRDECSAKDEELTVLSQHRVQLYNLFFRTFPSKSPLFKLVFASQKRLKAAKWRLLLSNDEYLKNNKTFTSLGYNLSCYEKLPYRLSYYHTVFIPFWYRYISMFPQQCSP